uniref:BPTI/Kunitz inhibitor domain-containing protein n=2 Tax=Onchocerca TaxID=6281 RepID=A0A2K6VXR9_ONCVO
MSHFVWYTLLSACVTVISYGPLNSPRNIMIRTECFNIYYPCPEKYRSRQNNLSLTTSPSTTVVRHLMIKTKFVNDTKMAKASLTFPSATTTTKSSSIWSPILPTLLSPLPLKKLISKMTTTTTITAPTPSTTTATPKIIHMEIMPLISSIILEELSSSSPDTTAAKQFTSKKEKLPKTINPCLNGRPIKNVNGMIIVCNPNMKSNGGCPDNSWCHVGMTYKSTVCCPMLENEKRCEQPMMTGIGVGAETRWYFNKAMKCCLQFIYKGLRGNANNFITLSKCMETCAIDNGYEKELNPCKYGEPAKGFDQKPLKCGSPNSMTCPKGFFCHIGASWAETACCERSGLADPCSLPMDKGEGNMQLQRYYYDDNSKQCKQFIYRGMKGNENSFNTYEECKQTCMRWDLVCEISPKVSEHRSCSANRRECGNEQWCHIGTSPYSSLCCAGASTNPCELPVAQGEGNETTIRWFADSNDHSCARECKIFTYKGLKGNQNNFLTKEDCEQQCKRICEDPCGTGRMLLTPKHTPFFCSSTNNCPRNYWCHIGAQMNTTVCCPKSGTNPCEQPMIKGTGNSNLLRWYFDQTSHKCLTFYYHGKEGNQNSFLTEDDCKNACPAYENPCGNDEPLLINNKPKTCNPEELCPQTHYCHIGADERENYCCRKNGNPCDQSMNQGEGQSLLLRYYYDKDSHRCYEFVYHGLRGNANNFLSEEDCEATCPVVPNPCEYGKPLKNAQNEPIICGGSESCPENYYCHIGSSPETTNCCPGSNDTCNLPLKVGKGTEKLRRWYYDREEKMCHQFIYRGLHGNANNFVTRETCQQNCEEMNPCGSGASLTDEAGRRIFCRPNRSDDCPNDYYCHRGSSFLTTQCCPRQGQNPCEQIFSIGYGSEAIPRWFYDTSRKKCTKFTYSGIGGNENNFLSKESCEESCRGSEDYCPHGDPLMEASGKGLAKCGVDEACPLGYICNMNIRRNTTACCQDPANFCLQPMDPGRKCKEFETRYGYDPELDDCVYYQYGGCDGTLNNFETLEKCTEICCKND